MRAKSAVTVFLKLITENCCYRCRGIAFSYKFLFNYPVTNTYFLKKIYTNYFFYLCHIIVHTFFRELHYEAILERLLA